MVDKIVVRECSRTDYTAALERLSGGSEPISFLQAPFYGAWQEADGKTVVYYEATEGETLLVCGLAVRYEAPGGINFLYSPYGPVGQAWSTELYAALQRFFADIARKNGCTFVRLDNDNLATLPGVKLTPNSVAVTASLQPRAEWLLDISPSEDELWMDMHKHARYNVRLAERANAKLEFFEPAKAPLDTFFDLLQTTAGRDSFSIQSREYYQAVLTSIPDSSGFVAICTIDGKPAAAGLFAAYDDVVHYVFAGSSSDFRKIAPPYFVIWSSILEAKKRGWTTLNFGGISDDVKGTHLAGVTGFKKRFGGIQVTHKNPIDLVYKPVRYTLFRAYKTLRNH